MARLLRPLEDVSASTQRVLIIAPNDYTMRHLDRIPNADDFEFIPVGSSADCMSSSPKSFEQLFAMADEAVTRHSEVAGVISPWDFPASSVVAAVAEKHDLPGPGLKAAAKCEHKYWSRLLQREAVPDTVPRFERLDPFDDGAWDAMTLSPPFWLKPIKGASSSLGFRIDDEETFDAAIATIRENIQTFSDSFAQVLEHIDMPERAQLGAPHDCIAEQIIGGDQVTVEGYVHDGQVVVHGIVDSIRHSNHSTFSRYQYPSELPGSVLDTMRTYTREVLGLIGYDHATFNVEFFRDDASDEIWLLEINPRIPQSHAAMFELVEGAPNFAECEHVAVGRRPPPRPGGAYRKAAKLFYRTSLADAVVSAVPSREEIAAIEQDLEGVEIEVCVDVGHRLSEMTFQDSYTFELALLHIGADEEGEILQKYQECVDRLTFGFRDMDDEEIEEGYHRVREVPQLVTEAR